MPVCNEAVLYNAYIGRVELFQLCSVVPADRPCACRELAQKDAKLGDGARRERERVEKVLLSQLYAVRSHDVLVVETARVLNAVMTGAQTAAHQPAFTLYDPIARCILT